MLFSTNYGNLAGPSLSEFAMPWDVEEYKTPSSSTFGWRKFQLWLMNDS